MRLPLSICSLLVGATLMLASGCTCRRERAPGSGRTPTGADRPAVEPDALYTETCHSDDECVALYDPGCGCPPCGKLRPTPRREGIPANCSVIDGALVCRACGERPRACPACAPLRVPEVAICEDARCILSRTSRQRLWVYRWVCQPPSAPAGEPAVRRAGIEVSAARRARRLGSLAPGACEPAGHGAFQLLLIPRDAVSRAAELGLEPLPASVALPRARHR